MSQESRDRIGVLPGKNRETPVTFPFYGNSYYNGYLPFVQNVVGIFFRTLAGLCGVKKRQFTTLPLHLP